MINKKIEFTQKDVSCEIESISRNRINFVPNESAQRLRNSNYSNINELKSYLKPMRCYMDIKEFAKLIGGKEYSYPQFKKEEKKIAKENGFVIVYGASDDLVKFDGVIEGDSGCFNSGKVYFNKHEICQDSTRKEEYPNCINALWCRGEEEGETITWIYETDIPHECFMIYEDGMPYCKGIVFSINVIK